MFSPVRHQRSRGWCMKHHPGGKGLLISRRSLRRGREVTLPSRVSAPTSLRTSHWAAIPTSGTIIQRMKCCKVYIVDKESERRHLQLSWGLGREEVSKRESIAFLSRSSEVEFPSNGINGKKARVYDDRLQIGRKRIGTYCAVSSR